MRRPHLKKGDRLVFWGGGHWRSSFLPPDTIVTVDYTLPDYGKIICKLDQPIGQHENCCLYDSEYGFYWGLSAQGIEAGTDETPKAAQPEGREPDPKDAPPSPRRGE